MAADSDGSAVSGTTRTEAVMVEAGVPVMVARVGSPPCPDGPGGRVAGGEPLDRRVAPAAPEVLGLAGGLQRRESTGSATRTAQY